MERGQSLLDGNSIIQEGRLYGSLGRKELRRPTSLWGVWRSVYRRVLCTRS